MAKQTINLGVAPDGAGGDSVRSGFTKVNSNFDEVYEDVISIQEDVISIQEDVISVKKYVDDSAIGVGQTWQDVTGSRKFETTYTNTAGRAIAVSVSVQDNLTNGTAAIRVVVGGEIIHQQEMNSQGIGNILNAFFIVPNGVSYRVVNMTVSGTVAKDVLHKWVELR